MPASRRLVRTAHVLADSEQLSVPGGRHANLAEPINRDTPETTGVAENELLFVHLESDGLGQGIRSEVPVNECVGYELPNRLDRELRFVTHLSGRAETDTRLRVSLYPPKGLVEHQRDGSVESTRVTGPSPRWVEGARRHGGLNHAVRKVLLRIDAQGQEPGEAD
jgi:hypothetical protein